MRFAIYEPEPVVCGPMVWASHLQTGFRRLGHDCDVVTFTRSGKARVAWTDPSRREGLHWRHVPPDVTARYRDAGEVLDGYDGVILNDARTVFQDRPALRGEAYLDPYLPDYVSVLGKTTTPFTFALHGNGYPPKELPFIERLLELRNFTGAPVTHSPLARLAAETSWGHLDWVTVPLPYDLRWKADSILPEDVQRRPVGITGRYSTTKGHHALAAVAGRGLLPEGVDVFLHGDAVVTRAPSPTLLTFEQLTQGLGLDGFRNPGSPTKPLRWTAHLPGDAAAVKYLGGYRDGLVVAAGLSLHVDLTAAGYSAGAMEFSQLEAIDAGRFQVSVESMWDPRFHGVTVPPVVVWPSDVVTTVDPATVSRLELIGAAVRGALELPLATWRESASHNRQIIRTVHAPDTIASAYVGALSAKI